MIFARCDGSCSRSEEGLAKHNPQPHNMRDTPCGYLSARSAMTLSRAHHFRSPSQPNPSGRAILTDETRPFRSSAQRKALMSVIDSITMSAPGPE